MGSKFKHLPVFDFNFKAIPDLCVCIKFSIIAIFFCDHIIFV